MASRRIVFRVLFLTMLLTVLAAVPRGQAPLRFSRAIELPRVDGRIDHLAFDAAADRLFVAALGNNTVEVLDVKNNTHLRSLPGFREPQGIAVAASAKVVAVANGEGPGIQLLDSADVHVVRSTSLGDDSDNVRYDSDAHLFYVGYGRGALASVRPDDGKVLGTVRLEGHPESFQIEKAGTRIFVNVPNADHIDVVDRKTFKVVATWPVRTATSNFPMALDEADHRLFVGCRRPAKALIFDTETGRETGSFDIVGDTDDLFYDAARNRLYVSGGEGFLDAFQLTPAGTVTRIAHVQTTPGARTSLFVADQHRIFLAVPHRGAQRAEVRIYDATP